MYNFFKSVVYLIILLPLHVFAQDCPLLASPPGFSENDIAFKKNWKNVAEPYLLRYAVKDPDKAYYGVGYLKVLNAREGHYYYEWPKSVVLPLWSEANENSFYGWLYAGRVYPVSGEETYALTGIGMVETEYEHNSFIVQQVVNNDWLKIKLRPEDKTEIWAHQCHLAMGEVTLAFETWETFLKKHREWLHFRAQVPHNLRDQPRANSQLVTKIGLDHKLILQEVKGDWMRVKVQQPDMTCLGESEKSFTGSTHKGWIKWRDEISGPWVWVYTRGC